MENEEVELLAQRIAEKIIKDIKSSEKYVYPVGGVRNRDEPITKIERTVLDGQHK